MTNQELIRLCGERVRKLLLIIPIEPQTTESIVLENQMLIIGCLNKILEKQSTED